MQSQNPQPQPQPQPQPPMQTQNLPQQSQPQMQTRNLHSHPQLATAVMGEYSLKKTSPNIGSLSKSVVSKFSLVEPIDYLYIRVVKAKDLYAADDATAAYDSFVNVRIGNYWGLTAVALQNPDPVWNQVFAFSKDRIHFPNTFVDVTVRNKVNEGDGFKGGVRLEVEDAPERLEPDSTLAPQWYKLQGLPGVPARGELMLAMWKGTQADCEFSESWHSDAVGVSGPDVVKTKSKVYMSPKLWYLRVNVIQVMNFEFKDLNRMTKVSVRALFGDIFEKTKILFCRNSNPVWNEDLMFVVAEPFESLLVLTVEDEVAINKSEVIGMCTIPVATLERRLGDKPVDPRWYNLKAGTELLNSKIQIRASLDGGYHVLDETSQYISDIRPTVRQLRKQGIGVLELGILNALGLPPMKKVGGTGRTDAYCVAKYGQKWVRTRTIMDSFSPQWQEQYTWEVFDPCTVITVGVFDNCSLQGSAAGSQGSQPDVRIGKIRIRLSTLETDKTYTYTYPLMVLNHLGLMKTGELQLAFRFSCPSTSNLLVKYIQPILPRMHYTHPLTSRQQKRLQKQALQLVASRLARSEPPLRKEVVEYLLDYESESWCKRRTLANYHRIILVYSSLQNISSFVGSILNWKKPFLTILVIGLLNLLLLFPQLILTSTCFYLIAIGFINYKSRPRNPPHMDPQLSCVYKIFKEDFDEEFNAFPETAGTDNEVIKSRYGVITSRYEKLRFYAETPQRLLGDLATQLERLQSLLNWRDPRATGIFIFVCSVVLGISFMLPLKTILAIFISLPLILRHPKFRSKVPPCPVNFFSRLPSKRDCLL